MFFKHISSSIEVSFFDKNYILHGLKPFRERSRDVLYMHSLGFDDFSKYKQIFNNNLLSGVEIKTDSFNDMFVWENSVLLPNMRQFKHLKNILDDHGLKRQIHFPLYEIAGKSLSAANPADHRALLHVFEVYAEIVANYGFSENITMHPPFVDDHFDHNEIRNALCWTNEFYLLLGDMIATQSWPIVIGLENQPDPYMNNFRRDALGYAPEHFTKMLKNTNRHIQLTLDSGHRNLSRNHKINDLYEWCLSNNKHIANFHFHANDGLSPEAAKNNICYDSHDLALPGRLRGYDKYLIRSVYENIPLNLEINFKKYSPLQIFQYISGLRETINYLYEN